MSATVTTRHWHLANEASLGLREARKLASSCQGINAKTAIVVPAVLGSMPFFWFCVVLAFISLPAVVNALTPLSFMPSFLLKASLIGLVAWVAQTFIQLVALPVLQVSNNAQMGQAESHTSEIIKGVQHAEDLLDLRTAGGLRDVRNDLAKRIEEVADLIGSSAPPPGPPPPKPKRDPPRASRK